MAAKFPIEFGEYRLLRKLAQGGMAEIFIAQDQKGRICALKRILPHLAHEEGFIRMFIDEARIVSHLDHPNVTRVYKPGRHEGYYFIAMEYVEGQSLLALSDRARSQKIPLPRGLQAYVIAELLAGLGHAHSARDHKGRHLEIVHRDVTPQNAMVSYEGQVKLIDFGVARARARLTQTEAGFTKGKLSYMSPEQARGEELDGRSDLFSVGIVIWEITTGHRLFNKEGPGGILGAIVNDPIPPPSNKASDYPSQLESIVMRALEKDVERRWQTAEDMRDALLRFSAKEKPRPSQKRLADLVHDLFGDPEHKKMIEEAQSALEVTPPHAVLAEAIDEGSVRIKGSRISDTQKPDNALFKNDDTRMQEVENRPPSISFAVAKHTAQVTSAGIPVVNTPIEHDDIAIPEPRAPARVRLAQALRQLAMELSESWKEDRRRWVAGLSVGAVSLLLLVALTSGATGKVSSLLGTARDDAREWKRARGLDPNTILDAGMRPTVLVLESVPPNATIDVDGIGAGCTTPCTLSEGLVFGRKLKIEFVLTGYRPVAESISLRPGEGQRVISVTLERAIGSLAIQSDPEGASVLLEGKKLKGVTPLTLDGLAAGRPIRVEVKKSGFLSEKRAIIITDGQTPVEKFVLEVDKSTIPPGRLAVSSSPTGCSVKVDQDIAGSTPLSDIELKAGRHTIAVECAHHHPETRTIEVVAGKEIKVQIEAIPSVFGYLSLRVEPPGGTKVRINGRDAPLPIEFVKMVPGMHRVEVQNAQLDRTKSFTLSIGPEQRVVREVNLLQ